MSFTTSDTAVLPAPDDFADCPTCWTFTIPGLDGGTGSLTDTDCQCLSTCVPSDAPACGFCRCAPSVTWGFTLTTCPAFYDETDVTLSWSTLQNAPYCRWDAESAYRDYACVANGEPVLMPRWRVSASFLQIGLNLYTVTLSVSSLVNSTPCSYGEVATYFATFSDAPCSGVPIELTLASGPLIPPPGNSWCDTDWPANCGMPSTLTLTPSGATCGSDPYVLGTCEFELCHDACVSNASVQVWRTNDGTTGLQCGKEYNDRFCRKWNLLYDVASMTWTLRSFTSVGHPQYTLYDETPCDGQPKTLSMAPSEGASGCEQAPRVVTITPSTDCTTCESATASTGCHLSLYRYCGDDHYELRTATTLSAVFADNAPDITLDDLPVGGGCCSVGYNYNYISGCPSQKQTFHGYADPWKSAAEKPVVTWALDVTVTPAVLTGTFQQGMVTYTADTDIQCQGVTHFTRTLSTLPDEMTATFPATCCVTPDDFVTCNVRLDYGQPGPRQNAGYSGENAHTEFCECGDTCEPTIAGVMEVLGENGICTSQNVCFTRQDDVPPQDANSVTEYPRIGCVRVNDGEKFNVMSTVIYCVGGATWAADWYCYEAIVGEDTRLVLPCSYYALAGTYLGTMYADKDACGPWPYVLMPTTYPPGVTNACTCATVTPPPVETDCCLDDPTPATLYFTMADVSTAGSCAPIDGVTGTLTYDAAIADWHGMASCGEADGWLGRLEFGDGSCDGWILLQCCSGTWEGKYRSDSGTWTSGLTFTGGSPPYDQSTTCSPFELLAVFYTGLGPITCCDSSNGVDNIIKITITA